MKNIQINTWLLFILVPVILCNCTTPEDRTATDPEVPVALQAEVREAENAFSQMAADSGVAVAFLNFAAEDAVLRRGNRLIKGKTAIKKYFEGQTLKDVKLQWKPDFIDVAKSGDMAYTYGPYSFSARDSTGSEIKNEGFFQTIWKKQEDGTWKFVFD